jgi:hypothetical protein
MMNAAKVRGRRLMRSTPPAVTLGYESHRSDRGRKLQRFGPSGTCRSCLSVTCRSCQRLRGMDLHNFLHRSAGSAGRAAAVGPVRGLSLAFFVGCLPLRRLKFSQKCWPWCPCFASHYRLVQPDLGVGHHQSSVDGYYEWYHTDDLYQVGQGGCVSYLAAVFPTWSASRAGSDGNSASLW